MKRRLFLLAVFLLIGAAINVGVAMGGFAAFGPRWYGSTDTVPSRWPYPVPDDWSAPGSGGMTWGAWATSGVIESKERLEVTPGSTGDGRSACVMTVCRIGSPFRSFGMYATVDRRITVKSPTTSGPLEVVHGLLTLPPSLQSHTRVPWFPIRPLAAGFITNTLLYAALAWALAAGLVTLRHARRRRRGLCARCGYPIGVSPVCTECGSPLPAAAAASG